MTDAFVEIAEEFREIAASFQDDENDPKLSASERAPMQHPIP
jgi:hypothetical protein